MVNKKLLKSLPKLHEKELFIREEIEILNKLDSKAEILQNPLAEESLKQFQYEDEDFKKAFNTNVTKLYYEYLYWKVHYRENINLTLYGPTRAGKTGIGIKDALIISKLSNTIFPLDASHIFKNQSEYLRNLSIAKPHNCYIIDEQKTKKAQIGSMAEEQELEDVNKITAKKCINNIWICPDLINRGGEFALLTVGMDRKLMLVKTIIIDLKNTNEGFYRMFGYVLHRHYDNSINTISPEALIKNY